jgi:cobalt-zinc-cadmium resistance protein CzcA
VPDITNVQVQINTAAPGYSPLETEQRVTYPDRDGDGRPAALEQTRSLSRYGLSQVTVIFKDGTDIYFARQLVNERMQQARSKLPPASSRHGADLHRPGRDLPVDRGSREDARKSPTARPTRHRPARDPGLDHQAAAAQRAGRDRDQHHRRLCQGVPGGAPPRSWPLWHDLAVVTALERNNANVGAGYIERAASST